MEKREGKGCAVIHYECFTLEYSDNNVLNLVIDHNNGEDRNVGFYRIYRMKPEFTLVLHLLL